MLNKLLKYDLEFVFKFLVIFYIAAIFFSLLTRLFLNIDNSFIMSIIGQICSGFTISMIFSILINNLMRMWIRFKNNIYGDEAYLTHTLPVEKKTLYLSKIITAVTTIFISFLVILLVLFIAYYSKENIEMLRKMFLPVANTYGSTVINMLLAFIFIFFLEFSNGLQAGYTGMILGYKMNNAKVGFSVLFGFFTYIAIQIFALISVFIVALFNKDIMNLFFTNEIIDVNMIKVIIGISIIIYVLTLIIGYIININLLKKGVNVD